MGPNCTLHVITILHCTFYKLDSESPERQIDHNHGLVALCDSVDYPLVFRCLSPWVVAGKWSLFAFTWIAAKSTYFISVWNLWGVNLLSIFSWLSEWMAQSVLIFTSSIPRLLHHLILTLQLPYIDTKAAIMTCVWKGFDVWRFSLGKMPKVYCQLLQEWCPFVRV